MNENSSAVVDVPVVDLPPPVIPPPVAIPIPPPTPPATPQFNAIAKKMMQGGQPVTQETRTSQTVYAGMPNDVLATPGATKKGMACVQYMAQIAQDSNCVGYQIEISRTKPAIFNGVRFPFGVLERFPPAPYHDIHDQIKEIHGGGSYNINVLDDEGRRVHGMVFNIETIACPPILRTPGGGVAQTNAPGASSFAAIGGTQDDILRLREEEQRARSEEAVIIAKNRVEETQRNIEKRRKREQDEEERRLMGPQNEEARRKLDDLRHETDSRFTMMNSSFEKLMLILSTQKPADNGLTAIMPMMLEMMKSNTQTLVAMMTAMTSGSGSKTQEMAQFLQMQNSAQEKIMSVVMNSATNSAAKSERLLEQLIVNRLEKPEESLKQALDMQERGKKDAMEMFRMLEDARGDRDDGDFINPDSGFFGNVGNLILHGLKGLVSAGARGGGAKAMELLSGILQKPPGTTQFSEQDLQTAAARIAQSRMQANQPLSALPAPTPAQALITPAAPPQAPAIKPKIKLFDRIYEVIPAAPAAPMAVPTPAIGPVPVAEVVAQQGTMVETVETVAVQQAPGQPSGEEVETDDNYINEAMDMAVADIKAGRREHDWVEFALGKWNRDFLQTLVQAPDDETRIKLLQQATDPELFNTLLALMLDPQRPENYRDFMENLKALCEGAMEGNLNAAA